MAPRPIILLSNDDGVMAPGIEAAAEALRPLGDLWICAPDSERSSCSHAMTLKAPVFVRKLDTKKYAVSGTPGDAAFIAFANILPTRPSLVVSGINYGPNLGKDAFYSGTVAAAREGAFRGVRSLAISLVQGNDFTHASRFLGRLAKVLLGRTTPFPMNDMGGFLLNVNVPPGKPCGASWTRLGKREYGDHVIKRKSPRHQTYYWIDGGPLDLPAAKDTDVGVVKQGRVSITPLVVDLTDEDAFFYLRDVFSKAFASLG